MNKQDTLHVIFGASGGIGNAVVRALVAQGKQVRGVNRSGKATVPADVEMVAADAGNVAQALNASEGASIIYNCVFPPTQDALIEAAAQTGAKLVLADNLYMYNPTNGVMHEDSPNDVGDRRQGQSRIDMTNELLAAHRSGKIRATIGRASDFFGPNALSGILGPRVFQAALDGKSASTLGNPDLPHTYTFVDDFARALITLAESDEADGQIWHVPSAKTMTTREFYNIVFTEAGQPPKIQAAGRFLMTLIGLFDSTMRDLKKEKLYQFESPFVADHSKFVQTFGNGTTPHKEAIQQTLDWYRNYSQHL